MNAEFQIASRDKKAFLMDQCKEIEKNNRIRKTRDLFKNQRYQGNSSRKDGNDNPICKTEKETQMYRTDFGRRRGWDVLREQH